MREMTEDEIFELLTNDKRNESHDEAPQVVMDNEIQWYELHDEVPLVASFVKEYNEIFTDEVLRKIFTENDIERIKDYMSNHDVDKNHLKEVFEHCEGWIRSQMSYDRGRPTWDLFIQAICHNISGLYEELEALYGGHKE